MAEQVNLLDVAGGSAPAPLELVRLDANETAVIPFTAHGERESIHFCEEPEINSYLLCNGADCLLCRVGKKKDERFLLPVFVPTSDAIGVLPVSTSLRPNALLPQLAPILGSQKRVVAFIRRDGAKFTISSNELPDDANDGEMVIKQFLAEVEAGRVSLRSVYQSIPNEQLASVKEIAKLLELKGISKP